MDECHQFFGSKVKKFHSFGHEADFYLSAIAALLHDIGMINGRENHAERSKEMAKAYLKKYGLDDMELSVIAGAIGCHSGDDKIVNLVDAALMMGDKMDITRGRILAFYDEMLIPHLSPLQKDFLKLKRVNFFLDSEYGHGVLEWGMIKDPKGADFNTQVKQMMELASEEYPKCINVPNYVTSGFLKMEFTFIVDDLT